MRFATPAMTGAIRAAAYNNTYRMSQVNNMKMVTMKWKWHLWLNKRGVKHL